MKPVVDISDCSIYADSMGRERLTGVALNYPDSHKVNYFKNNESIITSPIIGKTPNTVETVRTIYRVLSWADNGKATT